MMYWGVFGVVALACFAIETAPKAPAEGASGKAPATPTAAFEAFKNNYIVVYSLMMAGDWLQGPYVYALYSHYGFKEADIGRLFIAGFGSSMVFGTIVGSLADGMGRRLMGYVYCATYIGSCVTKHFGDYNVLMLGRVLGGISTSLLFSTFESWVVSEHFRRRYDASWLTFTFSKAIFFGNGLVAIVCGLVANFLVEKADLGPVAPFDVAICVLLGGAAIIASTWTENYGDKKSDSGLMASLREASKTIANDRKVFLLGAIQSLFEGSMYTFVFLWTPALSPGREQIQHGMIFATFMLCSMTGSGIAGRLLQSGHAEDFLQYVFFVAALALAVPVACEFALGVHYGQKTFDTTAMGMSPLGKIQYAAFLVFEVCVGIFWPSIAKLRSQYLPEETRSTVMNFFRIPLNLFVCVILFKVDSDNISSMFTMCFFFLFLASVLMSQLAAVASKSGYVTLNSSMISLDGEEGYERTDLDE